MTFCIDLWIRQRLTPNMEYHPVLIMFLLKQFQFLKLFRGFKMVKLLKRSFAIVIKDLFHITSHEFRRCSIERTSNVEYLVSRNSVELIDRVSLPCQISWDFPALLKYWHLFPEIFLWNFGVSIFPCWLSVVDECLLPTWSSGTVSQ